MSDKLLQVEHLKQYFPAGGMGKNRKFVKACLLYTSDAADE